jgi:OOP family OmpA-OmpF porin
MPTPPEKPTASITATPATVQKGQSTKICWITLNSTSVSVDNVGTVNPNDCRQVSPEKTTTYRVVAKGAGGSAEAATSVTVAEPTPPPPAKPAASITATPGSMQKGQASKLCWNTQNATDVSIDTLGAVSPNDCRQVSPERTTTYRVVAKGAGGSAEASTSVAVAEPPPPAKPTASITATPGSVQKGQSSRICWNTQNATDVSVDNLGPVDPNACRDVSPEQTTTYRVVAKGAGGSAEASTSVAVTQPPPQIKKVSMRIEVEFDTAKSDIKPKYHEELARAAEFLKKYPGTQITIEGHTDNIGKAEYNKKLSQSRAEAVRKYLIDKFGIEEKRMGAVGYGFDRPIADNATAEGRQKNRRIEASVETEVTVP